MVGGGGGALGFRDVPVNELAGSLPVRRCLSIHRRYFIFEFNFIHSAK